jgi:hypothetical protein
MEQENEGDCKKEKQSRVIGKFAVARCRCPKISDWTGKASGGQKMGILFCASPSGQMPVTVSYWTV